MPALLARPSVWSPKPVLGDPATLAGLLGVVAGGIVAASKAFDRLVPRREPRVYDELTRLMQELARQQARAIEIAEANLRHREQSTKLLEEGVVHLRELMSEGKANRVRHEALVKALDRVSSRLDAMDTKAAAAASRLPALANGG